MYTVFNMGVGFCVVVDPADADRVVEIAKAHAVEAYRLGYGVADPERRVRLAPKGLVGVGGRFRDIQK